MDDNVAAFDIDLAENLLERDGHLTEARPDVHLGDLPLTQQEADVLANALEIFIEHFKNNLMFDEDREIAQRLLDRSENL